MQPFSPPGSKSAWIQIGSPRLFGGGGLCLVSAFGLLLVIPVMLSVLMMSLAGPGLVPLALPFLALGLTAFFLPFGLGNPCVAWLVGRLHPGPGPGEDSFVVQLALVPRLRSGLWAIVEDADDIGLLTITELGLKFEGDSVQILLPFEQVARVQLLNVGLRGLFVYGARIAVEVNGLPNIRALEFAERSSWLLPASRRTTRRLHKCLCENRKTD